MACHENDIQFQLILRKGVTKTINMNPAERSLPIHDANTQNKHALPLSLKQSWWKTTSL